MVAKPLSHRNCRRISRPLLPRMKRRYSEIAVLQPTEPPRGSALWQSLGGARGASPGAERASNDARGSSSSSSSSLGTHSYGETAYWDDRYRKDGGPSTGTKSMRPSPLSSTSTSAAPTASSSSVAATQLPRTGVKVSDDLHTDFRMAAESSFGESMVDDGYQDIINIDISTVVIEAMQQKYKDKPALKYLKMDVRDMAGFESNSFDGVIDKGTLDSIMCGHNAHENATKMLEEVARVLKDKGVYILITYGDPSYRLCVLKNLDMWTINMHVIDRLDRSPEQKSWELTKPLRLNEDGTSVAALLGSNPDVHYIYVCIKDESLRQKRNNNRVDREAKVG
uniref:Methyltransferase type 11 domain-containing protein n=1 Tax=Ananas comosus var. bracteatus TaxID=296719 RepID=A0A6V7PCR7_ANACO|nr:unnamed protein product [Ananas comosus var. bracteatus]